MAQRHAADRIKRGKAVATLVRLGWRPPPLSNAQAARLLEDIARVDLHGQNVELAPTERRVLQLVADGAGEDRAAEILGRSPETIKTQTKRIRLKLGARTITQAVAIAMRKGLIS